MKDYLEPKIWKVRSGEQSLASFLDTLSHETGYSPITVKVLAGRGLKTQDEIRKFFAPRLDSLTHPLTIKDMSVAVERLAKALESGEKVRVFGDYDVDGTTAAALLTWIFRDLDFVFDVRQPDRFKDGYGLGVAAVEQAYHEGARVMVTVDCGITSFAAAERAHELGLDLIVVDHHQVDPARGLPKAHAVVNPQRSDCESGLKMLCGCGLAFYLAMALRAHGRDAGWFEGRELPNLKEHLDLVAIATAADQVPLLGDNRVLMKHGLEMIQASKKPGVRALIEMAGLTRREISPGHLGFVIGPRINASGRMQSASTAWELLTTEDASQASALASELERLNKERAECQNEIWDDVRARVEQGIANGLYQNAVVVGDPGWHEGVVGIVASRVTEIFRRPAVVISLREDLGKGSVRSCNGKDVLSALRECADLLKTFGGHKYAAGLSLAPENLDAFAKEFDASVGRLAVVAEEKVLWIEDRCELSDLDWKTFRELEAMGPFGPGNPEPVFAFSAKVSTRQVLKGRHLKLNLAPVEQKARPLEAIWFHAGESEHFLEKIRVDTVSEWAAVPEINRFAGRVTPTLRIKDWRG